MRRLLTILLTLAVLATLGSVAHAANPWLVRLPASAAVAGSKVFLRDVAVDPVPAAAGSLVLEAGLAPNTAVVISRQTILRKLVTAGLSAGVRFQGAERCRIVAAGQELDAGLFDKKVRREIQRLVPPTVPGAPASWFEFEIPALRLSAAGKWDVQIERNKALDPGRNLVRVRLQSGDHEEVFSAPVVLHAFDETARAIGDIKRDDPLSEALFQWSWHDLATVDKGLAVGRNRMAGASAARKLTAGAELRSSDLVETPLILPGDSIELLMTRGQVAVSVRAIARQKGCLHQTIPVRNELTGRLVNARVAGPGLVEWRK